MRVVRFLREMPQLLILTSCFSPHNSKGQIAVGHSRTSTATVRSQWALVDLNRRRAPTLHTTQKRKHKHNHEHNHHNITIREKCHQVPGRFGVGVVTPPVRLRRSHAHPAFATFESYFALHIFKSAFTFPAGVPRNFSRRNTHCHTRVSSFAARVAFTPFLFVVGCLWQYFHHHPDQQTSCTRWRQRSRRTSKACRRAWGRLSRPSWSRTSSLLQGPMPRPQSWRLRIQTSTRPASPQSIRCCQSPFEGGGWHLDSAQPKLQLAYNLEHEDYHKKRKAAVEEVNVKKQKLMEIQDRIRASALHQAAGDEEAPAAPEVQELKFVEPVDVASDEELFKDAEMEKHQPRPTFGRAQTSPTRRADQQLNRPRGRETSGGRLSSG